MPTKTVAAIFRLSALIPVAAFCFLLFFPSCSTQTALVPPDERFVHAISSGTLSSGDSIRVEFVDHIQGSVNDTAFLAKALHFEPSLSGKLSWVDGNTLEFKPSQTMPRLTNYRVHFDSSLLKPIWAQAKDFDFSFSVSGQALELRIGNLQASLDGGVTGGNTTDSVPALELSGVINTRDTENSAAVEKVLAVQADGSNPRTSWDHSPDGRVHRFTISGLLRGDKERELKLFWDGSSIGAKERSSQRLVLPPTDSFTVLGVKTIQGDENYVDLAFSDPVDTRQDLRGLIRYRDTGGKSQKLSYTVQGSRIKVYNSSLWPHSGTLEVDAAVRSSNQKHLVATQSQTVTFSSQKPAVRFAGTGVILPTTQGLTIPIESMNLKFVMVEATRVNNNNIPQFLQVNNLSGTRELFRVGKVVWRQVVDMGWKNENRDKWMRYGLDLTKLLQNNPDGLFRIRLTFRKPHVVWNDDTGIGDPATVNWGTQSKQGADGDDSTGDEESSYWDYAENEEQLDYDQRENPADPAYYHDWYDHKIDATRSVMISDIGLMAKRGTDGSLVVCANDIRNAQAMTGLEINILDFTMQPLAKAVTDAQGFVHFSSFTDQPYFVVAKNANQYGYLKLGDSDALSVSSFDVAGDKAERGIKGFLYGERGVWRPGDTMYLNFLLLDPKRLLPADHPVVLELFTPQNQLFGTWTKTAGTNGFYHFPVATEDDSPTGYWNARVRVGGRVFEQTLKVETIMPNRLKLDIGLIDSPNGIENGAINARLNAMWLSGIKAPNLRAQVQVSLTPTQTSFTGHPELNGYSFDDPARSFSSDSQTVFDGNLDQDGSAEIKSPLQLQSAAPGRLRANFDTRVYEPGGAFSSDAFSVDYNPYSRYIGIKAPAGDVARGMLLTDVDHTLKIVLVDPAGNPVRSTAHLRAEIYQIEWRWWWEGGDDGNELASYISNKSLRPLKSEDFSISGGAGQWKFRVAYPSWGRYLIRVTDLDGKHSTGVIKYIDWPGWAGRNQKDGPGGASILSLSTDKPSYRVGDTVSVSIPGNASGRALVSFERAGSIFKEEWLQPSNATTVYKFTATPDMAPNIYIHVTFLQPHLQTANDVPLRTYGIVPVFVENPESHLNPQIICDDVFKPGTKVRISVKEASGRPFTYTLALVDEGLLSLTRYKTPDPWKVFYKREASLVKSWDLYDFVAGAFAGRLENLLAIGGGDEGDATAKPKANRFPPVVRFIAPTTLEAGATNTHEIDLPEYVGAVRVMVVAASQPKTANSGFPAYGTDEKSVLVKKEVMVLGTLPRVLSPGEEADVPVSVFYAGADARSIPVKVSAGGSLVMTSQAEKQVHFTEAGEQIVSFRVKARNRIGIGTIKISAVGASDSASQSLEMDVRVPSSPITIVSVPGSGGGLGHGQNWTAASQPLPGFAGSNTAKLELSIMPPLDLARRLDYLIQYPYGCIEQTTSSVFPQLYLGSLMELDAKRQAEIQNNVQAAITRLSDFRTPTGGFSYWPGEESSISAWGTNYAGHFLLEAKRAGYAVPSDMLASWRTYQQGAANSWNDQSIPGKIDQAYRLYTLALDGSVELSALNRLKETSLPDQARWRLAAAYFLVGQADVARNLVEKASTTVKRYRELGGNFGSDLRDRSMILESMALLDMNAQVLPLARDIGAELSKDQWLSTQETAYALLALSRVVGLLSGNGQIQATVTWKDSSGTSFSKALVSTKPILITSLPVGSSASDAALEVKNDGSTPVFPRLLLTGIPAPGTEREVSQGLRLKVRYLDDKGNDLASLDGIQPGSDVYADITVQNLNLTKKYEQLALSHLVPSGFEIINSRMGAAGQDGGAAAENTDDSATAKKSSLLPSWLSKPIKTDGTFDYQDIRDDRIYTYFSMVPLSQKVFRIHLNATYRGTYYLPALKVEAMYDSGISALLPGYWMGIGEQASAASRTGGQ